MEEKSSNDVRDTHSSTEKIGTSQKPRSPGAGIQSNNTQYYMSLRFSGIKDTERAGDVAAC